MGGTRPRKRRIDFDLREANEQDLDFLAQCYVKIALEMQSGAQDFYISRLPGVPNDATRSQVARYVGREGSLALLVVSEDRAMGCLLGTMWGSSFSAARLDKVGHIAVCWVEPQFRKAGVAARLTRAAEDWFRKKDIHVVELSYMTKNKLAAIAWRRLGYEPFRVFAYKQL